MFEPFYQYIQPFAALSQQEEAVLENAFSSRQAPKKYKLQEEGKITKELYFIIK
ncbi:cyclic nucleotide-binding domain-containing protein [Ilyomonas limi]|uniref:hypothetical protein n=1 Tax=Ilyomonas limi TaxID=2575867 RepID=UPI0014855B7D|nr:hypothetical protein [Ilyomonas limi]